MIPLLRTLTRKSKIGFGKYKDETVQQILDMNMPLVLITPYYKLTSINYIEDVLIELGITEEYRIKKPSSSVDDYYRFLDGNGFKKRERNVGADKLITKPKLSTRAKLQSINHGRK